MCQFHRYALTLNVLIVFERDAFQYKSDHSLGMTFDNNLGSKLIMNFGFLFKDDQWVDMK